MKQLDSVQSYLAITACSGTLVGLLATADAAATPAAGPDPSLLTAFASGGDSFSLSSIPASLEAANPPPVALANYARAGWQATLSTFAHDVSGTVTIVDADTFRVDNFYYNGGGINVHFILAAADDNNAFRTARLVTDLNLLGTAHNGDSITMDLPTGSTFDGYGAISVWCLPAQANFGSGTFVAPEPTSMGLLGLGVSFFGLTARRRPASAPCLSSVA